jgi:hypothetical protein
VSNRVYALVADLAASRRVEDRPGLSRLIEAVLRREAKTVHWSAPPVTTRGLDEISAIVRKPEHAFDFIVTLNLTVWPHRFRFALASGALDVSVRARDAAAADGEAFHRTAEALARAKRDDLTLAIAIPELADDRRALIETLARLHSTLLASAPPAAIEALRAQRSLGGATQTRLAARLGQTQQSVSAALRRANARDLAAAEDAIRSALGLLSNPPKPQ